MQRSNEKQLEQRSVHRNLTDENWKAGFFTEVPFSNLIIRFHSGNRIHWTFHYLLIPAVHQYSLCSYVLYFPRTWWFNHECYPEILLHVSIIFAMVDRNMLGCQNVMTGTFFISRVLQHHHASAPVSDYLKIDKMLWTSSDIEKSCPVPWQIFFSANCNVPTQSLGQNNPANHRR